MPRFLTSQLSKYFWPGILLCLNVFAQANDQGHFQKYEELISTNQNEYSKKLYEIRNNVFDINNIKDVNQVTINPLSLNGLIFNSPSRYLLLAQKDKCSLYDLISTTLLKEPGKPNLEEIIIDAQNLEGEIQSYRLKKDDFLNKIAYKQCPGSKKLAANFEVTGLRRTFKELKFEVPNSVDTCYQVHQEALMDVKTPFICEGMEAVRLETQNKTILKNIGKNQSYKKDLQKNVALASNLTRILKPNFTEYFQSLCLNLENKEAFCQRYFDKSFWDSLAENKNKELLDYYCHRFFPSGELNEAKKKLCLKNLAQDNKACYYPLNYPALTPAPNCDQLATTLNFTRLNTNYKDCPARVGNLGIVNFSRMLRHFNQDITKFDNCQLNSTYPVAQFDQQFLDGDFWKAQLCYNDPLKKVEICYPVLLNESNDELALSNAIGKILSRLKGFDNKSKSCRIITSKEYQPLLLEYQSGCYIIKSKKGCNLSDCKLKVILDQKEFKDYKISLDFIFDLFPFSFSSENRSLSKRFKRFFKKQDKSITNMSTIINVFKTHKQSILWGVACEEDLLPSHYQMNMFAQCTPLPFIVDGYLKEKGLYSLSTRTAKDHIDAPRLIPWSYIFSGLKRYQKQHPLSLWGLYAFY